MTVEDLKQISTSFFYEWYNQKGNNTEQGFDEWINQLKEFILKDLSLLYKGYGTRKLALAKRIDVNEELLTVLLRELKHEGKVKILMLFSEDTGMANGSGYCLSDEFKELKLD